MHAASPMVNHANHGDHASDGNDEHGEESFYDLMQAQREATYRGLASAGRCLACRHLPSDGFDPGDDRLSIFIHEERRHERVAMHAEQDCDTCPYLPENYGRPVRLRVPGVDDWGDHREANRIRLARFIAWEARHVTA